MNKKTVEAINKMLVSRGYEPLTEEEESRFIDEITKMASNFCNLLNIDVNTSSETAKPADDPKEKPSIHVNVNAMNKKTSDKAAKLRKFTEVDNTAEDRKQPDKSVNTQIDEIVKKHAVEQAKPSVSVNDMLKNKYNESYKHDFCVNYYYDKVVSALKSQEPSAYEFIPGNNSVPTAVKVVVDDIYSISGNYPIIKEIADKITSECEFAFTTINMYDEESLMVVMALK